MSICRPKFIFVLFQICLAHILRISSNANYVIWSWNDEFNLSLAMDKCNLLSLGSTPVYGYFSCSIPEDKDEYIVVYSECDSSSCDSCDEKLVDTSTEYKCDGFDSYAEFDIDYSSISSSSELIYIATGVCFSNNDYGQMVTCDDSTYGSSYDTATTFDYDFTNCVGIPKTVSFSAGSVTEPWNGDGFAALKFEICFDDSLDTTDDINYVIDYFSVTIDSIVPNSYPIGYCSALSAVIPEYATYTCVYDSSSSSWTIVKEIFDNDECSGDYTSRNQYVYLSSIETGSVGDFSCDGQNLMVEIEIDCLESFDYQGNSIMRIAPGICFYNKSDSSSSKQISNMWDCPGNSEKNLTLFTYFDTYNCDNTPEASHSITSSKCAVLFPEALTGSNGEVVGQVSSSTNGYYCFSTSSPSNVDSTNAPSNSKTEFYQQTWFEIFCIIMILIIILIIGICWYCKQKQNKSKQEEEIANVVVTHKHNDSNYLSEGNPLTSSKTTNANEITRTSNVVVEGEGTQQVPLPQYQQTQQQPQQPV